MDDTEMTLSVSSKTLSNLQKQTNDGEFCDVILQVDDQEFPVHRNVLAASSEYFLKMFTTDMKEKNNKHVPIKSITSHAMNEILKSIYNNKITFSQENLDEILHAASLMQISVVLETASVYIAHVIDLTNCFWFQDLVSKYSFERLLSPVLMFFMENIEEVFLLLEFLTLECNTLDEILASNNLVVEEEKTVFEMVLKWTNFDLERRKQYFPQLFKNVRLQFVSIHYVIDTIRKNEIVKQFHECRDMLDDAMSYHINPTIFAEQTHRKCFVPKPDSIMLVPFQQFYQVFYDFENRTWKKLVFEGLTSDTVWNDCACATKYPVSIFCGGQRTNNALDQAVRFDGIRWMTLPSMNVARCGAAAVFFKDDLYVFGGEMEPISERSTISVRSATNPAASNFAETYEKFDKKCWEMHENSHTSRSYFAAQAIGDKIYLIGGYIAARSGAAAVVLTPAFFHFGAIRPREPQEFCKIPSQDTLIFYPDTNRWIEGGKLHTARASFGCVVLNSKIYVVGGCDQRDQSGISGVEILNTEENIWTMVYNKQCFGRMAACSFTNFCGYALDIEARKIIQYSIAKQAERQRGWFLLNSNVPENGLLIPYSKRYHTHTITKVQQID